MSELALYQERLFEEIKELVNNSRNRVMQL